VDAETHKSLFDLAEEAPNTEITIDLESQSATLPGGQTVSFPIDPFSKTCLLKGVDQLGYIMSFENEIAAYEQQNGIAIIS
jgi:3-isopropylmalate/(R)-2-methylmalate dehydratase small subunit